MATRWEQRSTRLQSGELEAQVKRNTRVDTGQTKGSWTYKVDEANGEAMVGSPQENAIWEEFGTGQYALNGDGERQNGNIKTVLEIGIPQPVKSQPGH